jgi:hypothetical protein
VDQGSNFSKSSQIIEKQELAIEKKDVQLYRVQTDPDELIPCVHPPQPMEDKDVFLLVHTVARQIYIWLGSKASVRTRFVGARCAINMHRDKGMVYHMISVDQTNESPEFRSVLAQSF